MPLRKLVNETIIIHNQILKSESKGTKPNKREKKAIYITSILSQNTVQVLRRKCYHYLVYNYFINYT